MISSTPQAKIWNLTPDQFSRYGGMAWVWFTNLTGGLFSANKYWPDYP
jgi:hypothetical protein